MASKTADSHQQDPPPNRSVVHSQALGLEENGVFVIHVNQLLLLSLPNTELSSQRDLGQEDKPLQV